MVHLWTRISQGAKNGRPRDGQPISAAVDERKFSGGARRPLLVLAGLAVVTMDKAETGVTEEVPFNARPTSILVLSRPCRCGAADKQRTSARLGSIGRRAPHGCMPLYGAVRKSLDASHAAPRNVLEQRRERRERERERERTDAAASSPAREPATSRLEQEGCYLEKSRRVEREREHGVIERNIPQLEREQGN